MYILFRKSRPTINEHILYNYEEDELVEADTMRKIGISDFSTKPTKFYDLDALVRKTARGTGIAAPAWHIIKPPEPNSPHASEE